jgi:hypothetical protein
MAAWGSVSVMEETTADTSSIVTLSSDSIACVLSQNWGTVFLRSLLRGGFSGMAAWASVSEPLSLDSIACVLSQSWGMVALLSLLGGGFSGMEKTSSVIDSVSSEVSSYPKQEALCQRESLLPLGRLTLPETVSLLLAAMDVSEPEPLSELVVEAGNHVSGISTSIIPL